MKILVVHNRYREPGGEDSCVESETKLLEEHGHEVIRFDAHNASIGNAAAAAAKSIWNRRSYLALRRLMRSERPAIAHFHNVFHVVSPSGYWAAFAENVPVVQTLHNFRLLCPNGLLFRDGRPCEDCVGRRVPWPGVLHACYRGSVGATLSVGLTTASHRALGTWRARINAYIAPSEFTRSRFVNAGFPADRIFAKPNFLHFDPRAGPGDGGYALFAGRLSPEKGVPTLLEAWKELRATLPLWIIGDGPLAEPVARAAQEGLVRWLGRRSPEEVYEAMGRAACLVMPSACYETGPRVILESLAKGTPVVVSDAGASKDLVGDGFTGVHFKSGDPSDLVLAVRRLLSPELDASALRRNARDEFERKYSSDVNYQTLMSIYARAIANASKSQAERESVSP